MAKKKKGFLGGLILSARKAAKNSKRDDDKKQTYKVLSEISCYDLYDFLKGFEIVRTYMIEIEPIKVEDSVVKKVLEFSKTLAIEE